MEYFLYLAYERTTKPIPSRVVPKLGRLKRHEVCFLRRKRNGATQADVARMLGRSRYWVRLMETGAEDCAELEEFWGNEIG